jgi:hypothetical protein
MTERSDIPAGRAVDDRAYSPVPLGGLVLSVVILLLIEEGAQGREVGTS